MSTVEKIQEWDNDVVEYKLCGGGIEARIYSHGGIIHKLLVPDKEGKVEDIVLGYDTPNDYGKFYFGALIGRFANRIAAGIFSLDGKNVQLDVNKPPNHLHGGYVGFDKKTWQGRVEGSKLVLSLTSEDGDQKYPGTLEVEVIYELTDAGELMIDYTATCDAPTVLNLTNHSYFNLEGHTKGNIYNHEIKMSCNEFTPADANSIPTGEIKSVSGSAFDLRNGKRLTEENLLAANANGYDNNFIVPGAIGDRRFVARVSAGGRTMEVFTTQPGVQFYTSGFLDCPDGKDGAKYGKFSAFCLETQHFPDSPNKPSFPSAALRPGEIYHHTTWYKFSSA